MKKTDEVQPIIIKKIKKGGGGHHGGAWKVAYADFVTAMMAFFLLLWLLNVTTEDAKNAIANYFDPTAQKVSQSESGAGGVMGGLSMTKEGAMADKAQQINQPETTGKAHAEKDDSQQTANAPSAQEQQLREQEDQTFLETKAEIVKAVFGSDDLKELAKHLVIDVTPEGLRIQIIDQDGDPMFPSGSAQMYEKTRKLLSQVADLIKPLPNPISLRGHTDATKYSNGMNYSNWELSSDRANASRRILEARGIPATRIANIMGKASSELFIADKPLDPRNRRITILLMREELKDAIKRGAIGSGAKTPASGPVAPAAPVQPVIPYQKTQGTVQFP